MIIQVCVCVHACMCVCMCIKGKHHHVLLFGLWPPCHLVWLNIVVLDTIKDNDLGKKDSTKNWPRKSLSTKNWLSQWKNFTNEVKLSQKWIILFQKIICSPDEETRSEEWINIFSLTSSIGVNSLKLDYSWLKKKLD